MKVFHGLVLFLGLMILGCTSKSKTNETKLHAQFITVLGIAQDAGYPHIGCDKVCCNAFFKEEESKKLISCLGLIDLKNNRKYIFDATPDFTQQVHDLSADFDNGNVADGIFLTHAHIGHYSGLMYLGFEAMNTKGVPVYAMPQMKTFLETNGPWNQLVSMKNVELRTLQNDSTMVLSEDLKVTPFLVPHRDEYSETVGYKIEGTKKSLLFIPDINKWELWDRDIIEEVKKVDYAFIDATFFKDGEVLRPMKDIPHPFIIETTKLFENESVETKSKIYFIHLNHTNPALKETDKLKDSIQNLGFNFAIQGMKIALD